MKTKAYAAGLSGALVMLAVAANAQILYAQAYTPKWTSHEARIFGCGTPRPYMKAALDDWAATVNSPVTRVTWWGTLSTEIQAKKMYYIAFYRDDPVTHRPVMAAPLWKQCVTPDASSYVSTDCKDRRVYKMTAKFNGPYFYQQAGKRYWIQISEADKESYKINSEDFRWSAHRSIANRPALQWTGGAFVQPLFDPCDQKPDDLAFVIHRT